MLHAITIKNQKKPEEKKYRYGDGFPIEVMAIHPSKKFLVLAAQGNNTIEFVEIKNYKNIKHILTVTHEHLNTNFHAEHNIKKMTFSFDREYLFVARGEKCLMLDLPLCIKFVDVFERFFMKRLFEQGGIPADVRKSIWYFLFQLFRKEYHT